MRHPAWIATALACLVPFAAATARPDPSATLRAIPAGDAGRPSGLDAAFGVDVGPDGRIYVALALRSQILVLDRRTGAELDRIGIERGVDGPDDVEVGDDGTIYWTSPNAGTISALFSDGTVRSQLVAPGLNPITIRDDGRVFVAAAFTAQGLFEVDPQLLAPPRAVIPDISGLNGFDFGPDGLLYSPDTNTGAILRIDVDATPPTVETVLPPGSLPFPGAVTFDPRGVLHAIDASTGQAIRIDIATGSQRVLLDVPGSLDNLAFDADGTLYVTLLADGQILRRLPFGLTLPLPLGPRGRSGMVAPAGVTVDSTGALFVADIFSLRRVARGRSRDLATFYSRFVDGDLRPLSADFAAGAVVSATFGGVVQTIDARDGSVLDQRLFRFPSNAVFAAGDIAVAELLSGSVVRGDGSPIVSGLLLPLGLADDGDGIFVGDFATGTIVRAPHDGGPVSVVATGLLGPEGIARFRDWLIVAETIADRVTAIDLRTGATTTLIEIDLDDDALAAATGVPPFGLPNGVAVDEERRLLYLASDRTNEVLAFRLLVR